MANEKETVAKETGSSNPAPIVIIGLIILATIVGIWWISQSGAKKGVSNTNSSNGQTAQTQQPKSNYSTAPAGASPERFKGSQNASVVIEEFADFQCGACAQKHSVFNEINSAYGSKVKFVFRHYPLIRQHPKAYDAAVASEAAGFQNKFWEMQNLIFANQLKWINDPNHRKAFEGYAKTLNLDVEKFTTDSLGLNAKNRVDADMRRGNALALSSTPTLFINGKPVSYEQMTVPGIKAVVDGELARMAPKKDETATDEKSGKKDEKEAEKKGEEKEKTEDKK